MSRSAAMAEAEQLLPYTWRTQLDYEAVLSDVADAIVKREAEIARLTQERDDLRLSKKAGDEVRRHLAERIARELTAARRQEREQARRIIVKLVQAFLSRHGCFPTDQTTENQRQWHSAMSSAYEWLGGQEEAIRALAARDAAIRGR